MEKEGRLKLLFMRWKRGYERGFGNGVRFEEMNKNNTQFKKKRFNQIIKIY